ncbi:putative Filamentous hemagglutinin family outer membrane protein [Hyella patelloides LEGE 07179]|uniref:Putative Filamentous hemagglutinin family outer membrane protein n=1 Tax=Hyella patelloides LEGE 07179 TaxID=945734 RepID=A0A563VQA8_9CYAN|nr:filamentous hemagglutinin N-terminal domain-containing protein [Hyella patelloides]VEP13447.1 putative Filamentous hemagglutinin family outer membrane protein [Hyella patelloides LEGE 07179]
MKPLSSLIVSVFFTLVLPISAVAQVIADDTTSTTITPTDTGVQIDDGNRAEGNLFHSFDQFSIPRGSEAFFNNAEDIANIFSRVTGGNISNIDGLIRANGSANLFLINPAGIIFGEGASLQLGGSFYGSTADSIVFGNGEFNATDLDNPPLITVNAPIGLNFRDEPGKIINRSVANNQGLSVAENQNIALIGGDIKLEGGLIATSGGNIELASIAENGVVSLEETDPNFSVKYDEIANFGNIELSQGSRIDIGGENTGSVNLQANQISLTNGSRITSKNQGSQPGKDITVNAFQLLIEDNSQIITTTTGEGNAGNINLNVEDSIEIIGTGFQEFEQTFLRDNLEGIFNLESLNRGTGIFTGTGGGGTAGKITLNTTSLKLQQGAVIGGFVFGEGDSEKLTINATESIDIDSSGIFNSLISGSTGNGNLSEINTTNLTMQNSGLITSITLGSGSGGDIFINVIEEIKLLEALSSSLTSTGIFTNSFYGNGKAGNLAITTQKLSIQDGGQIVSSSGALFGGRTPINIGGQGGDINIIASDSIHLSGFRITDNIPSVISSNTFTSKSAGDINIKTGNLIVSKNAEIVSGNIARINSDDFGGSGDTGFIDIFANSIQLERGGIVAETQAGSGGNINLDVTENITLQDNSLISAQAFNEADGGNLDIKASFIIAYPSRGNGNDILASAPQGQGGTIEIRAESLLGIQERDNFENNNTNDINASSGIDGLDGNVFIETPEVNSLQEVLELSNKLVLADIVTTSNACSPSDTSSVSSLVVEGKGGIPAKPIEPFTADALIIDGELDTFNSFQIKNSGYSNNFRFNPNRIPSEIEPVAYKDNGEPVYLARGIIKQEDGSVILTAYPTADTQSRTPENPDVCSQ